MRDRERRRKGPETKSLGEENEKGVSEGGSSNFRFRKRRKIWVGIQGNPIFSGGGEPPAAKGESLQFHPWRGKGARVRACVQKDYDLAEDACFSGEGRGGRLFLEKEDE